MVHKTLIKLKSRKETKPLSQDLSPSHHTSKSNSKKPSRNKRKRFLIARSKNQVTKPRNRETQQRNYYWMKSTDWPKSKIRKITTMLSSTSTCRGWPKKTLKTRKSIKNSCARGLMSLSNFRMLWLRGKRKSMRPGTQTSSLWRNGKWSKVTKKLTVKICIIYWPSTHVKKTN